MILYLECIINWPYMKIIKYYVKSIPTICTYVSKIRRRIRNSLIVHNIEDGNNDRETGFFSEHYVD